MNRQDTDRVPVYILAGGRSSRFGTDKARAVVNGKPLICLISQAVFQHAEKVCVVADSPDKYADLGFRTVVDVHPGQGPLGGLETALLDCSASGWLLILSCDLIQIRSDWVQALLRLRGDDRVCVAFRPRGLWQPLLALYHTDVLPIVQRRLSDGHLRMQDLLNQVHTVEAPVPENWPTVLQANTPEGLNHARF